MLNLTCVTCGTPKPMSTLVTIPVLLSTCTRFYIMLTAVPTHCIFIHNQGQHHVSFRSAEAHVWRRHHSPQDPRCREQLNTRIFQHSGQFASYVCPRYPSMCVHVTPHSQTWLARIARNILKYQKLRSFEISEMFIADQLVESVSPIEHPTLPSRRAAIPASCRLGNAL